MDSKTIISWLYSALETRGTLRSAYLDRVELAMPKCQWAASYLMELLAKEKTKPELYRILSEYGF